MIAAADWLPYVAVVIAAVTFVASQIEIRRRAKIDYVGRLEKRIEECERDRADRKREVAELRDENLALMRRVMRLEGPS